MSTTTFPRIQTSWRQRGFRRRGADVLEVTAAPRAETRLGHAFHVIRHLILGRPFRSELEREERLAKRHALTTIGADNIASSVYGPESMLRALVLAGGLGALTHTYVLSLGLLVLLFIVATSYLQTIDAYPTGGGSYVVAKDNLGLACGLVAGVALMIDYVLNVAVSVAAGVMSITSILPGLSAFRVPLCLAFVTVLTIGNLRGNRSAAWFFSTPVYLYLASALGVIAFGAYRWSQGLLPGYAPAPGEGLGLPAGGVALGAFAWLRAYASGAVALSGVEAISNGVPAFREPETRNAKITLVWMTGLFGTLFAGLTLLGARMHVLPDPLEVETIVSRIARTILGPGPLLLVVQTSAAVMLAVAANTSYADFPRLANIMAHDRFLPARFSLRGHRLAFSHGIVALSLIAATLIVSFRGSLNCLVPLFTIGLFISFTMSEVGMVVHHWRTRGARWRLGLLLNGCGALVTGGVALLEAATKFTQGAWMVLVLVPTLALTLARIRHHLTRGACALAGRGDEVASQVRRLRHHVLIPVEQVGRADLFAVSFVRSLINADVRRVEAVHVAHSPGAAARMRRAWAAARTGVALVILESPYRGTVEPLVSYVDALRRREGPDLSVDVFLPEPMPQGVWRRFLHQKLNLVLKAVLMVRNGVTVTSVPYHF